jgi:hypothetical protein
MRADADDCISRRLVPFIEQQPARGAWYSETGWYHRLGSRLVIRSENFHMLCGTSCVSYVSADDLPSDMEQPSDEFYLVTQGHNIVVDYLRKAGSPVGPVPFPTTVYITNSGENWSGQWTSSLLGRRDRLAYVLNTRPLTRSIRDEFGLYLR